MSDERQRILFDAAFEGIAILERGRIVEANAALCRMFGYEPAEMIGRSAVELAAPESRALVERHVREGFEGTYEAIGVRRDGTRFVAELRGRATVRGGRPARITALRDISDRKRAEAELQRALEFNARILEGAHEGILVLDAEGRHRFWNPAMERMSGMRKEDVLGRTPREIAPAVAGTEIEAMLARLLRGERVAPMELRPPGGGPGTAEWIRVSAGPLRDAAGRPDGIIAFVDDISEWKRREVQQRRTSALLEAIVEGTPDAIFAKDLEGRYLLVNRAAAAYAGRSREELLGRDATIFLPPEEARKLAEQEREIVRSGALTTVEESLTLPAGGTRTFLLTRGPLRDPEGRVTGSFGIGRDVTERRRGERDREKLQEQLLQSRKLEAIGLLAGGVAHDFNNLLTAIQGYASLALARPSDPEAVRECLLEVRHAGDRAASLTRQLLAFSRRQVLKPEALDLNGVLRDLERLLRRLIGEHIEIVTEPGAGLGAVLADRTQIEQVIMNLVVNARDAMPQGGRITIATANVDLPAARPDAVPPAAGPCVRLSVSDTGRGMDEATRARCFEPFYTTKEKGSGTGLGLSTAYGIIRQSGGDIEVESAPGRGTTFRVYLPRVSGAAAAPPATADETAPPARGETVLVVEDERAILDVVTSSLRGAGHAVLAAAGGAEALQLAAGHPGEIALVLSDVVMPEMDGRTVVERLRQARPGLRALFMSGYFDEAVLGHGVLEPGTELLEKPFTPPELLRKVRAALDAPHR